MHFPRSIDIQAMRASIFLTMWILKNSDLHGAPVIIKESEEVRNPEPPWIPSWHEGQKARFRRT